MKSNHQTLARFYAGTSTITPPTSNKKWFSKYFKHLALFAVMLTAGVQEALADPNFSGSGTSDSPYIIANKADLLEFGKMYSENSATWDSYRDKCFRLDADIELENSDNYIPAGSNGTNNPMAFTGTFDGYNKTITGIHVDGTIISVGFISKLSENGTIKDLTIANSSFKSTNSNSCVGAIAGIIEGKAQIINCKVIDCTINGKKNVGGIVGYSSGSDISNIKIQYCRVEGITNIIHPDNALYGAIIGKKTYGTGSWISNYYEWTVTKNGNQVPYDGTGWACEGSKLNNGKADIEPVDSWAALKRAMSVGVTGSGVITLSDNCTDEIKDDNSYLHVPSGKTVVLDLNGFTINRNLPTGTSVTESSVILNNGTLTIKDTSTGTPGSITGGVYCGIKNTGSGANLTIKGGSITGNGGRGIYHASSAHLTIDGGSITGNGNRGIESRASLTINGGSITGNAGGITIYGGSATINDGIINDNHSGSSWDGGGIWISSGSLTIKGGSITGNSAGNGGGIYVNQGCTLTIDGGSISGNSAASYGGGIYIYYESYNQHGTLKIGGDCTIYGNLKGENQNNVYLPNTNSIIQVTGNLDAASIGITAVGTIPRVITSNSSGKTIAASNFSSDNASYGISISGGNAYLKNVVPSISMAGWTYGDDASSPTLEGYTDSYETYVSFTYKAEGASDFSGDKPIVAGTHTVKATVTESENYIAGEATTTYTVSKATLTISGTPTATAVYGTQVKDIPVSATALLGQTEVAGTWAFPSGNTTVPSVSSTTEYTATFTPTTGTGNYNALTTDITPTITQKAVTVSGITASNKTYDGNTTATLDYTGVVISGKIGGDDLSVTATGQFDNANVGASKTVTINSFVLSGSSSGNYYVATSAFSTTASITTKALTISADNKDITYGDEPPTYTVSYDGFVDGENSNNLTDPVSCACVYAQFDNATTYTITPSGATSTNYAIAYTPGTLTVEKKEVGLNWSTPTTFTYDGDEHAPTATATGIVNSDVIVVTVTGGQTNASASNYTATASALTGEKAGNYKLPAANTQAFIINRRAITVTPNDGQSKTYGDSDPTLTYTVSNIVSGESLSGTLARDAGENVSAVPYAITQGEVTNANNGNYNITFTSGKNFTILPKTVGISWGPTILTYDGSAQAPTATATGLKEGDACNVTVTGQQTAVGIYNDAPATASELSNANYQLPATGLTTGFEIVNPLSISFAANQTWATWYGNYNYEVPASMTAYKVSSVSGSTVTVDAITYVPANTGVLIKRETTGATDVNSSVYNGVTSDITSLLRSGSPIAYTDYILYNDGFVLSSVSTIGEHRCYLPASGAAGTRSLTIDIGDGTTDIAPKAVEEMDDGEWYDLQGRRIEKPQKKGLYIRDGKKVVVK